MASTLYSNPTSTSMVGSLQRTVPSNSRNSNNYSLSGGGGLVSAGNNSGHRKSAVELLAESKAFYVKSETVRGRTQTLPLLSHTRTRHRNERSNIHPGLINPGLREIPGVPSSTLNRRSTGPVIHHSTNADMLQNALRKLLDCGSPVTSLENVTNHSSTSASNDISFDMDCTTPISPPAEYAFCASASERRYATRSLSHSQPVSASRTRSGELPSPHHENGCCSAHLVVLAKSLPDLHAARNLSSSFEGSRSNKSITSDVFSLNRDSGGDSSGHLTHKSEPVPSRRQTSSYSTMPLCTTLATTDKHWQSSSQQPVANIDLRRDSGSSTQHSGSYYHNANYYDPSKHNIYDPKNYNSQNYTTVTTNYSTKTNRYEVKSESFEIKTTTSTNIIHYSSQEVPKSAGYYEKNSPCDIIYNPSTPSRHSTSSNPSYYCRITKQGYPVPMSMARTEIVQAANDQKIVTQNVRNSSQWSSPSQLPAKCVPPIPAPRHTKSPTVQTVIYETTVNNGEIILPPPIECCDNYSQDNTSFMDTIIPPPVFEMENDNLEVKNVSEKSSRHYKPNEKFVQYHHKNDYGKVTLSEKDNMSESSFHENVAPTVRHENNVTYRHLPERGSCREIPPPPIDVGTPMIGGSSKTTTSDDGPISLPFDDPELSPGLGTFKRQKCFRFKQKSGSSTSGRPILRSKSDISDRYRRNSKSQPVLVRKSCGGEISRSVSHLEQFFEQLGLNSDAYDNLFIKNNNDDSDSPVYFSDVSTVDSNRPVSQVDSTDGGVDCPANNMGPSNNVFRSSEQPSIVERNARIIKWLCNCRKAQLAANSNK